MAKAKRPPDDKEQSKRFIEKAKEVVDEDADKEFNRALDDIIPPAPLRKDQSS